MTTLASTGKDARWNIEFAGLPIEFVLALAVDHE
jgi:hypothetical protein